MTRPPTEVPPRPTPPPHNASVPVDPDDRIALKSRFRQNRDNFPAEQLAAYAGQMVAWWPDGSRIFDADVSHKALYQRLRDAGYALSFFMLELIPLPGQPEIDPV